MKNLSISLIAITIFITAGSVSKSKQETIADSSAWLDPAIIQMAKLDLQVKDFIRQRKNVKANRVVSAIYDILRKNFPEGKVITFSTNNPVMIIRKSPDILPGFCDIYYKDIDFIKFNSVFANEKVLEYYEEYPEGSIFEAKVIVGKAILVDLPGLPVKYCDYTPYGGERKPNGEIEPSVSVQCKIVSLKIIKEREKDKIDNTRNDNDSQVNEDTETTEESEPAVNTDSSDSAVMETNE